MKVTQLVLERDALLRDPEQSLALWPTLSAVAEASARVGIDPTVVAFGARAATMERGGVTYRFVPLRRSVRGWRGVGGWRIAVEALLAPLGVTPPDVVHLQGLNFPVAARVLCDRLRGVPVLAQDHGSKPPAGMLRSLIHRWGLYHLRGVAFTAREQAVPYMRARVLRSDMPVFEVLESSSRFTTGDQQSARNATGLYGDPCLLWIGRLNANKDPVTVMEAVGAALADLPDAQMWCFYADAPLLPQIRQLLAVSRELGRRVHLMGAVEHSRVELLCRAADFLVLGSHSEGSGYAVLEALACGLPPLVTDIPSFRRLVGNAGAGALWSPGDVAGMARALVRWSRQDRARLRLQARAHFERALSFATVAAELRAAYEGVLAT